MLLSILPLHRLDSGSSGGKFISADGVGHVCTVTGALISQGGRLFDGDDFINIGTGVNINGSQSFGAWFKYGSYSDTDVILSNTNGSILAGLALRLVTSTSLRITLNVNDLYYQLSKTVAVDTWYLAMCTFNLSTATLVFHLSGDRPTEDTTGTATARSVGNMEIGRRPFGGGE